MDPVRLYPPVSPLTWPELTPLMLLVVAVAVAPAWLAPPPTLADHRTPRPVLIPSDGTTRSSPKCDTSESEAQR